MMRVNYLQCTILFERNILKIMRKFPKKEILLYQELCGEPPIRHIAVSFTCSFFYKQPQLCRYIVKNVIGFTRN